MTEYRIENETILRPYLTEDGGQGMHCIPLAAVATRMELLGLTDPGAALDAIVAEADLPESVNPYDCVYSAIAEGGDVPAAQAEANALMPVGFGPDDRGTAEIKTTLCDEYGDQLRQVQQEFREGLLPTAAGA